MATFPAEENKILALGREVSAGLKAHKDTFPNPPVDPEKLDTGEKACIEAIEAAVVAQAAAEQATATKNAAIRAYANNIKSELRYAENAVNFDDLKLKLIGWGGRKEKTPLAAPGRALNLIAPEEGEGWIKLHWNKPIDGGKPAAYNIVCRERTAEGGSWSAAGTAFSTEITLTNQPRGKPLEFGVVAANKAGEGPVSNTVTAVL
uniref:Fibronectin type-III domain-containing protein n=1 Tax=Candidatus Kentrum sp. LPFa TaxID=2126335 RepID=A0A450X8M8_9GAMM|nr:MAG: hypothetical protein BECKLPF1236A_GA0070988_100284 [Candidatus Kentron sp. LPFa]VFK25679.1 MAG: hypothetical protein BECKLPF1236C_GA0070990_100245 [Candidatus Kentron sp. LPFa]